MRNLCNHAAGRRRILELGYASDPIEPEPDERLALLPVTAYLAPDLHDRYACLEHVGPRAGLHCWRVGTVAGVGSNTLRACFRASSMSTVGASLSQGCYAPLCFRCLNSSTFGSRAVTEKKIAEIAVEALGSSCTRAILAMNAARRLGRSDAPPERGQRLRLRPCGHAGDASGARPWKGSRREGGRSCGIVTHSAVIVADRSVRVVGECPYGHSRGSRTPGRVPSMVPARGTGAKKRRGARTLCLLRL
jgi:hypothetical protein